MIIQAGIRGGETWRQTAVHGGVDQFGGLREQEFSNVVEAETGLLHRISNCHCLEVPAVVDSPCLSIDQRIIGGY